MLPKIFTEQLMTWTIIVLAVVDLARGDMIAHPFVPKSSRDTHLTGIIFCMNMGKYVYKAVQDLTLILHLSNVKVDLLHHSVTLTCYAVFYSCRENLLLGLVGILMESDLLCNEVIRIYKEISCDRTSKCYKRLVTFGSSWTLVSRGVVPVAFLITAVLHQDVMAMQFITIIFWFLAIVFFLAINIWIIFRSGVRMRKAFIEHPLPVNARDVEELPSGEDQYHQSDATPAVTVTCPAESPRVPEKTIPLHYKNDLSYLSPYSNINISGGDRNTKLNVSNKKATVKDSVHNIAALFKATPLQILDKRRFEGEDQTVSPSTPSRRPRTFTEMTENCRRSPMRESVIDMRADESRDVVPSVVIFSPESHQRPGHTRSNYHRI
ncbi:uncharacterized protein LOC135475294 [Liolophura sinensis]|uniref:uncharacterized protein LOC135475294 n=1 Tax=Liolophura sinensis TaxID=3198878 RepID=UPI003158B6E2